MKTNKQVYKLCLSKKVITKFPHGQLINGGARTAGCVSVYGCIPWTRDCSRP